MNTLDALIRAAAEDDLARLALADHLEETGDRRAPWAREPALWRWSRPDLGDPLSPLLDALDAGGPREPLLRGCIALGERCLDGLFGRVFRTGPVGELAREAAACVGGPGCESRLVELFITDQTRNPTIAMDIVADLDVPSERLLMAAAERLLGRFDVQHRVAVLRAMQAHAPRLPPAFLDLLDAAWQKYETEKDESARGYLRFCILEVVERIDAAVSRFRRRIVEALRNVGSAAYLVSRMLRSLPRAEVSDVLRSLDDIPSEQLSALFDMAADAGTDVLADVAWMLESPEASPSARRFAAEFLAAGRLAGEYGSYPDRLAAGLARQLDSDEPGLAPACARAIAALGPLAASAAGRVREIMEISEASEVFLVAIARVEAEPPTAGEVASAIDSPDAARRWQAVRLLAALARDDDGAADALVAATSHDDPAVRMIATAAVAADARVRPGMADALVLRLDEPELTAVALRGLARLGPAAADAAGAIRPFTFADTDAVRRAAYEALGAVLGDSAESERELLGGLALHPAEVIAALSSRAIREPWTLRVLARRLFAGHDIYLQDRLADLLAPRVDESAELREEVRAALASRVPAAVEAAARMLNEPSRRAPFRGELLALIDARPWAYRPNALALAVLGAEDAAGVAERMAGWEGDENPFPSWLASRRPLPPEVVPSLAARLDSEPRPGARLDLLRAISNVEPTPGHSGDTAARLLDDPDAAVRAEAARVLGRLTPSPDARRRLARSATADDDPHAREAALTALAATADDAGELMHVLRSAMGDFDPVVRDTALRLLARRGGDEVIPDLRRMLTDTHEAVRGAAAAALLTRGKEAE